jgi:redox-sensitive bicupin YhaK (pirin superfamily)
MVNHQRKIALHNCAEKVHGITRYISPKIQKVDPFISLEVCGAKDTYTNESLMSHSSGTAIIILIHSGEADYRSSTDKNVHLKKNDLLWLLSGSGISYSLKPKTVDSVSIKLEIALSPALENAPAQSTYLESNLAEHYGPAQILLGLYGDARSGFALPALINYLLITLRAGQSWTYETPTNHSSAWIAVINGKINTSNTLVSEGESAIYEESHKSLDFFAIEDSIFLIGSSVAFTQDKMLIKKRSSKFKESVSNVHLQSVACGIT